MHILRISPNQKGYKCCSPVMRKIYNSMDASFFELQPFYSKPDIQGENNTHEYQLWDVDHTVESHILPIPGHLEKIQSEPIVTHIPQTDPVQCLQPRSLSPLAIPQSSNPVPSSPQQQNHSGQPANSELRVYTKRKKGQVRIELQALPQHIQESDPSLSTLETLPGNNSSGPVNVDIVDVDISKEDLDRPIALRKGVGHVLATRSITLFPTKVYHQVFKHSLPSWTRYKFPTQSKKH